MSDTPETSAMLHDCGDESDPSMRPHSEGDWVPAKFARKLERERDNLIDQRDRAINLHEWSVRQVQDMADECNKMGRERDQWRKCAERLAARLRWYAAGYMTDQAEAVLWEFERLKEESK